MSNSASAIAHSVFFTLQDSSAAAQQALLHDCYEYLEGHEGVLYFAAGLRGAEFDRPVNDDQFHVALHVVFESRAAHDTYQTHPRHVEFLQRNKPKWSQVRIFDYYV